MWRIAFRVAVESKGSRELALEEVPVVAWAPDGSPAWSPDGRKIVFVSKRDGNGEVYVMNADGRTQRNLTRLKGRM